MKGSILDLIVIIPIIVVIAISVIFSSFILNEIDDRFDKGRTEVFNSTMDDAKTTLLNFDYSMIFLMVGLCAAVIIGAFMVNTHPIFFFFTFLLLGIFEILSMVMSNLFGEIIKDANLAPTAASFPLMTGLIENLPLFTLLFGALIAIAMYTRGDRRI